MDLLNQVNIEYSMGLEYTNPKKTAIRRRIKKRNNQSKNKINITFVADTVDTLISGSYTDLLTVRFVSRDGFFGRDKANSLTYIAKFDQKEMERGQMYYQKEQDRYTIGVSIRAQLGRDNTKSAPKRVVINPLSAIPDPRPSQTGSYSINNYRFIGFFMTTNIYELIKSGLYSKASLDGMVKSHFDAQREADAQAYAEAYGTGTPTIDDLTENFSLDVYYHFTIHEGKKYMLTLSADLRNILRQVELEPVTKEEKNDASLIPRPIILNYYKPQRNNFYGESIRDQLETKQDAMNIFANLAVATAKKEALGGRFLWNSRLIKNKEDILRPSVDTQHFWIDENELQPGESIANVGMEIPQPSVKSDVMGMYNFLETKGMYSVGIDSLQSGVAPDKNMTKAEAQQLQANSNLKNIRNKKVDGRGDRDYWYLRWRAYIQYFSKTDKKTVLLDNDFERNTEVFGIDTFDYKLSPYIEIGSEDELNAIDEQKKQFLSLYLPQAQQNPNKSQLSKDMLEREFLRVNHYTPNQINVQVPLSKSERIMINDYIPMLNADIVPEGIFSRVPDIFTAYVYTQLAQDTKAKKVMVETLNSVMSKQDIQNAMSTVQDAKGGAANSASNIQMAQSAQQIQSSDLITRGNLKINE